MPGQATGHIYMSRKKNRQRVRKGKRASNSAVRGGVNPGTRPNVPNQAGSRMRSPGQGMEWARKAMAGLSLAGVALTIYLSWVAFQGTGAAFCTQGSGCDVIQASQWSKFLGLPLALWGAGLYGLIALYALARMGREKRWRRLWQLSGLGLVISVYLTGLGLVALGSLCAWCLTSFTLLAGLFTIAERQRHAGGRKRQVAQYLAQLAVAGGIILVMFVSGSGILGQRGDPRLHGLAEHLARSQAVFYGAYWCPSCAEQKRIFGAAAEKLPYVECAPGGPNSPMTGECARAGVSGYPTWVIDGRAWVGVRSAQDLAAMSGYDWEAEPEP